MKQLLGIAISSLFIFIVFTGCASSPHINSGIFGVGTDDVQVQVAFGDNDRRLIHDYYRSKKIKHKGLPPGLAKKGKLPPGIAKRYLPNELEARLSPIPRGYVRLEMGGNIVLMNKTTEVIVDSIYNIR